jgi:hypothetical protein
MLSYAPTALQFYPTAHAGVKGSRGCSKIESAVGYTQPDETPKPSHHA